MPRDFVHVQTATGRIERISRGLANLLGLSEYVGEAGPELAQPPAPFTVQPPQAAETTDSVATQQDSTT